MMHGGGAPWGAPQGFYPSGDYGANPPSWPSQALQPSVGGGGFFGRPQPLGDNQQQRLKDEQRRRQLEYSQALAEQVRQRELQKQHEKEARRREDAAFDAQHGGGIPASNQQVRDRGLFDGLGQSNPGQRANFGRGRREPPMAGPPTYGNPNPVLPPPQMPPMEMAYPPQPQVAWSGHAEALGFADPPQQQPHYGDPGNTPRQNMPWLPEPVQPMPPPNQQPQAAGGRRLRTDLHTGGIGGDDAQKQQRLQQQLDMQETLRRQIEDKQRQKLEEKRKREDDERREMEKFELEKRRQNDEQERLKEERRRKAQADDQHFRMQQEQLAAANAAAQEQKQHQRNLRHSPLKAETVVAPVYPHHQSPRRQRPAPPPPNGTLQKNPFTNSRAHLFEDPPSPQLQLHRSPPRHAQAYDVGPPPMATNAVDTRVLLEQYEHVRAELERQRELVERLHAQMQIHQQQQQPPREEPSRDDLPTLSDLERLRQELRDELAQRETQHRSELDALMRRQQLEPKAPSPVVHKSQTTPSGPRDPRRGRGPHRRHDAFVQDALSDDEGEDQSNQRLSPTALKSSLSAASLQCESQLVFFDGRVQKPALRIEEEPEDTPLQLEDSVDELVEQLTTNQREPPVHRPVQNHPSDDDDDTLGFFIQRFDTRDQEPSRYHSVSSASLRASQSEPFLRHPVELQDVEDGEDDDASLDGEALEAIFQRNVRRHEILTGFEAQHKRCAPEPVHWDELHRKLRDIPSSHTKPTKTEPSLAASSRWMPAAGNS